MKVYLAARFDEKNAMQEVACLLERLGIDVTSRWVWGHHDWSGTPDEEIPSEALARFALEDLEDIDQADVLVAFTAGGIGSGGRHVELGYALARKKAVVLVGTPENVFHHLPTVQRCDTIVSALQVLLNGQDEVLRQTWGGGVAGGITAAGHPRGMRIL